jgi:hypothetical protein
MHDQASGPCTRLATGVNPPIGETASSSHPASSTHGVKLVLERFHESDRVTRHDTSMSTLANSFNKSRQKAAYCPKAELCLLCCGVTPAELADPFSLTGVWGSRLSCAFSVMIHSCCSNSAAEMRFTGSRSKQRFKKSIPVSLSWSRLGSCGGSP